MIVIINIVAYYASNPKKNSYSFISVTNFQFHPTTQLRVEHLNGSQPSIEDELYLSRDILIPIAHLSCMSMPWSQLMSEYSPPELHVDALEPAHERVEGLLHPLRGHQRGVQRLAPSCHLLRHLLVPGGNWVWSGVVHLDETQRAGTVWGGSDRGRDGKRRGWK